MLRGAGHATGSITVQHLRMQVGGVADHGESPANFGAVLNDPDHVWTRTKPQALMLALGPPLSAPRRSSPVPTLSIFFSAKSSNGRRPRSYCPERPARSLLVGALLHMSRSVWRSGVIWINTQPGSTR